MESIITQTPKSTAGDLALEGCSAEFEIKSMEHSLKYTGLMDIHIKNRELLIFIKGKKEWNDQLLGLQIDLVHRTVFNRSKWYKVRWQSKSQECTLKFQYRNDRTKFMLQYDKAFTKIKDSNTTLNQPESLQSIDDTAPQGTAAAQGTTVAQGTAATTSTLFNDVDGETQEKWSPIFVKISCLADSLATAAESLRDLVPQMIGALQKKPRFVSCYS